LRASNVMFDDFGESTEAAVWLLRTSLGFGGRGIAVNQIPV
jgi:hypothetical protein